VISHLLARRFYQLRRPPFVPLEHAAKLRLANQLASLDEFDRVGRLAAFDLLGREIIQAAMGSLRVIVVEERHQAGVADELR
jgi:hypothetical protein